VSCSELIIFGNLSCKLFRRCSSRTGQARSLYFRGSVSFAKRPVFSIAVPVEVYKWVGSNWSATWRGLLIAAARPRECILFCSHVHEP